MGTRSPGSELPTSLPGNGDCFTMRMLHNGERFPALTISTVGGGRLSLPNDLAGSHSVVLVNRGSWCPYCNAQLAGFARAADKLAELGIKVVAMSVDDKETA